MIRDFFARIFAALAYAAARFRGGVHHAWAFLSDAVEEAAEPLVSRLPWLRERAEAAGAALKTGAEYGAVIGDGLLSLPGRILGGLMPWAPTPQAVADEAVASDDAGIGGGGILPAADIQASLYRSAAQFVRDGDAAGLSQMGTLIPGHVADWLRSLDRRDIEVACRLEPAALVRHALANSLTDCSPMLPPPLHLQPQRPLVTDADLAAMKAQARRNLANSGREAAAMSTRTPARPTRPAPEPTWDDMPDFGPRPALH